MPYMDGAGNAGSNAAYSRGDHVHPSDTSKLSLSGGVMSGPLTLAADGVAALHAVTKQQLDALTTAAGYAPLASPVFTGNPQAPTPTAGDNDTSLATTQFVQSAVSPYSNNAGRNLLHNSRFEVQQRGAGPWTVSLAYTADRWMFYLAGPTTYSATINALSDADRAQIGDESAQSALVSAFTGTSGASDLHFLVQRIENLRRISGKTLTVSFWAKASAALSLGVSWVQLFGTGGSPSGAVIGTGQAVALTTSWSRYTVTITPTSTIGKTFGTNGDSYLQLELWLSAGSNSASRAGIGVQSGTVQLWGVQLEVGSVATPLARRDPADELALCQRFYQTGAFDIGGYQTASGVIYASFALPVTMRSSPGFTTFGVTSTNVASSFIGAFGVYTVDLNVQAAATGTTRWQGSFNASADL